ncbi:MAG: hypothetical protein P4L10_01970 [Acidobacteriaceae bacterium]|nr:hypothetical protein [Acidobacteriaceae bacterium]
MTETANPVVAPPNPVAIADTLGQILRSAPLRNSAQLQTLLKYLVEVSLNGSDDALKERTIGIEVFGRKPDYDTANDPIVRSRVGLLRKRLAEYYKSGEAKGANLQIVIPNGSYYATFVFRSSASNETRDGSTESEHQSGAFHGFEEVAKRKHEPARSGSEPAPSTTLRLMVVVVAASLCATIVIASLVWTKMRQSELDLLWAPLIRSNKTVLLYSGTTPVFLPSTTYGATVPRSSQESGLPAVNPPLYSWHEQLPIPSDLTSLPEGLASPGYVAADVRVAALLSSFHRVPSFRFGSNLAVLDLTDSPLVLVGSYDNFWTIDITRDLPFFFDRAIGIRERNGTHRLWTIPPSTDYSMTSDYAVIFRLVDAKNKGPVLGIAGLSGCGTQAAAEFVTDASQMRKLPRSDLKKRNIEFVLHASIVNCTPTSTDVVAVQAW